MAKVCSIRLNFFPLRLIHKKSTNLKDTYFSTEIFLSASLSPYVSLSPSVSLPTSLPVCLSVCVFLLSLSLSVLSCCLGWGMLGIWLWLKSCLGLCTCWCPWCGRADGWCRDVAQLEHQTSTPLMQVQVPDVARNFFSQSQLSVQTLLQRPYTPVCNLKHQRLCAHERPYTACQSWWIMETHSMHRRSGSASVAAGFPQGKQPKFPLGETPMGQYSCKKKKKIAALQEGRCWYVIVHSKQLLPILIHRHVGRGHWLVVSSRSEVTCRLSSRPCAYSDNQRLWWQ